MEVFKSKRPNLMWRKRNLFISLLDIVGGLKVTFRLPFILFFFISRDSSHPKENGELASDLSSMSGQLFLSGIKSKELDCSP